MTLKLLTVVSIVASVGALATLRPVEDTANGELRCEGQGAIVIRIAGEDYAVNGMASSRYPPIQRVWNRTTNPEADIDRLIVGGIKLCEW